MSDTDDIVREFLVESTENLDQLDRDLVALEKDPQAEKILASVFRTIHTIKGTSGFLGFNKLESVTHVGESLLSKMRDGELVLNAEITSGLLAMVDAVREMLANIEATGQEGERDYQALIESLTRLQSSKPETAPAQRGLATPTSPLSPPEGAEEETREVDKPLGEILVEKGKTSRAEVAAALDKQNQGDPRRVGEILVENGSAKPLDVLEALQEQKEIRALAATDSNIRVDVGLLDKLMNLVGELVLARNQILQFSTTQQDPVFLSTSQRLNLITTELQEGVMKTRMQPIGNIWARFPRLVRDLATSCGKQVRIEMEGKETELDKTLVEAIKDPLTHVVRNAVDHGIETPEERVACGKPAEGRLFLCAFHEGGQVNIEISDDGAGINLEQVKQKAIERGLITPDHAARMGEREILNLIFLPGFSTAKKVTNVSGRGVGMDVVKTNIEKIGGVVDMQSRPGQGTTLKIKIPLTLAIIPALIVTSGGDRYAIPQVSLLELVRLEGEQARKGVEMIHGAPVYRLRGHLLPLVYLKRELKGAVEAQAGAGTSAEGLDFAVARSKHEQWFTRLREFLDGKTALTVEQAGSHKDCALGKWLYSTGLREFGAIPEMQELEKTHAGFHALVKQIVSAKNAGHHAQAEQEFEDVKPTSAKIIELLTAVEKKVLESQNVNIVVLQADDRHFGLVVDEINDTEEIVVKPLGKQLKGIATFAGATIMGDGRVALILDVLGLAQQARVVSETRDRGLVEKAATVREKSKGLQTLLLFRNPDGGRMAIPLSLVARLEEFERSAVEKTGSQHVVQYRGEILPLIFLYSALDGKGEQERNLEASEARSDSEKIQVVVYTDHGRSAGLVVDRILDIVESDEVVQSKLARKGTLGMMVTQGRVTELLDVEAMLARLGSNFVAESVTAGAGA
jgi:two-component system chemotaxis sensor kinase CheA